MEARDAGDAERWDIAISRSSIKGGLIPAHCCCEGSLESSWSKILVQAALAASSADRTDAAAEILTVIRTATHHEASALLAWDPVSGAHAPLAAFDYEPHTVMALGDRYALSPEHQSLQRSHARGGRRW